MLISLLVHGVYLSFTAVPNTTSLISSGPDPEKDPNLAVSGPELRVAPDSPLIGFF